MSQRPAHRLRPRMMRQAGRYQASYRRLAERYPSFRQRSETTELIVEISLQPWDSFAPDGVILFSDILTPLPALGLPFEIDDRRGPIIQDPIRHTDQLAALHALDVDKVRFTGDALCTLRASLPGEVAVLGFVGCPWTVATYAVEGGSSSTYKVIKSMRYSSTWVFGWEQGRCCTACYSVARGAHGYSE